jgi:MoaA/NifB/PqqE/SkfB family radical SAM enzyme
MERMGVLEVLLNGGEPLLHPHIKEILLDLTERRFRKIIITNGTLFNEKITSLLKDSGTIPTISLDDSSEERHDSFRGSVGSFRCIMDGFKLLSKKGIQYGINSCLNRDNLKRVRELIELACRYNASRINFLSLRPAGRMREHLDGIPSYKEYEEAALRLMIERQRFKDKIDVTFDALLHCYTLKESQQEKCHGYVCCQAGINCFSIDCTGYVFPCNIVLHDPNWVIGNIKEEKLLDLWFSPKWAFFRGGVRIKDLKKCSSCKKLSECKDFNCRLEAYLETGDPLGAPLKCNV